MDHTLEKLKILVDAESREAAWKQQNEVSRWCKSERLWAILSEKLDALLPADRVVTIPRIEIDVTATDEAAFQQLFVAQVLQQIVRLPEVGQADCGLSRLVFLQKNAHYFLKNGFFDVSVSVSNALEIRNYLTESVQSGDPSFWAEMGFILGNSPIAFKRLVQHFGLAVVRESLIKWIHVWRGNAVSDVLRQHFTAFSDKKETGEPVHAGEMEFWIAVLAGPERLGEILEERINGGRWKRRNGGREEKRMVAGEEERRAVVERAFFVLDAGVVLVTPFLRTLFESLGWMEDGVWVDAWTPQLGVRLLDYIVWGDLLPARWEDQWILPKIICGLAPDALIAQDRPISDREKASADEMLAAVIGYWPALKAASPDTLRESFLRRSGKLSRLENGPGWRLQVKNEAQDILLSRISWGFGVTSLPWMTEMLFTDWA